MSDYSLREFERAAACGDPGAVARYNRARIRFGLKPLKRKIVHYIRIRYHHRLGLDGKLDSRVSQRRVYSACGSTEVWPRRYYPKQKHRGYTTDKELVTCKTCLRCLNSPKFVEDNPWLHLVVASSTGDKRIVCGGQFGRTTEDVVAVGCEGCHRVLQSQQQRANLPRPLNANARGRRRLRRQSDPFRHGMA